MIKAVEPGQIPDDIKCRLPVLDFITIQKKDCKTTCPYYAGEAEKKPRCMLKYCYVNKDAEEVFHPVLKEMFSFIRHGQTLKDGFDPVEIHNRLLVMFFNELKDNVCKQSPCYGCPYTVKDRPCVICMKKILAY